jgi:hypothetical protein
MTPRRDATCTRYLTDGLHDGPAPVTAGIGWISRVQSNDVNIKRIDINGSHIRIVDIKRTTIYGAQLR